MALESGKKCRRDRKMSSKSFETQEVRKRERDCKEAEESKTNCFSLSVLRFSRKSLHSLGFQLLSSPRGFNRCF